MTTKSWLSPFSRNAQSQTAQPQPMQPQFNTLAPQNFQYQLPPVPYGQFNTLAADGTSTANPYISQALNNMAQMQNFTQLAPSTGYQGNMPFGGMGLNPQLMESYLLDARDWLGTAGLDVTNMSNDEIFSTASSLGFDGGFGGAGKQPPGFLEKLFLGTFDEKTRTSTAPLIGTYAQGVGALATSWAALKNIGLSEDALDFSKKSFTANFEMGQNAGASQIREVAYSAAKLDNKTNAEATQIAENAVQQSKIYDVQLNA